ncbi:hypothetical protein ADEAN_000556100 [Angomonas deanei]|uniref:RING-type domain-containing protein n=1 Tax=Angomonas deanei TaxID=59799 RepID=A0A7G2CFG0_9TRYP|nr:hypothetical protein ADEAN_000556100 [Angomonas deanei]
MEESPKDSGDDVVDLVAQELRCVVCYCVLIDPRVLKCQHSFCLRCLFFQVNYDRGEMLSVSCPFRCHENTISKGDIRTLPRNLAVSNIALLIRKQMYKKAPLIGANSTTETEGGVPSECEWCSRDSESCRVCPHCYSNICPKCRGPFSNHYYLCTELHDHAVSEEKPVSSPLTDAYNAVEEAVGGFEEAAAAQAATWRTIAPGTTGGGVPHYPFFITKKGASKLLVDHLTQSSSILPIHLKVEQIDSIRIATKQNQTVCTQVASGFSSNYDVIPKFTLGNLVVNPQDQHWGLSNRGSEALLLLANTIRVGQKVYEDMLAACREVTAVLNEVKSVARRALIIDNQGFQLYACHVMELAREEVVLVRNCILPQMLRLRHMEGLIGDAVINRYHQVYNQMIPSERHSVRSRCISFSRIELVLVNQADALMKRVFTKAEDLESYIDHLGKELVTLAQENSSSTCDNQSIISEAPCPSAKVVTADERKVKWWFSRSRPSRGRKNPPPSMADDPIHNLYADHSFLGQFHERSQTTEKLTTWVLQTLRHFLVLRQWCWFFTNTTVREIGLSEENCEALLTSEHSLQLEYDELLKKIGESARLNLQWEFAVLDLERMGFPVEANARLISLIGRKGEFKNDMLFSFTTAEETLGEMRRLRAYLSSLEADVNTFGSVRSYETQAELLNIMSSVVKTGHEHSKEVIRNWCAAEAALLMMITTRLNSEFHLRLEMYTYGSISSEMPNTSPEVFIKSLIAMEDDKLLEMVSQEAPSFFGKGNPSQEVWFYKKAIALQRFSDFGEKLRMIADGELTDGEAGYATQLVSLFPNRPQPLDRSERSAPHIVPRSHFFMFKTEQTREREKEENAVAEVQEGEEYRSDALEWMEETLFRCDDDEDEKRPTVVLTAKPISRDMDGKAKASQLFKQHFKFNPSSMVTASSNTLTMPFYVGLYSYKNGTRLYPFAIDAQTSDVWTVFPTNEVVSFSSYVAMIVGSPLFFILLNVLLKRFEIDSSLSLGYVPSFI